MGGREGGKEGLEGNGGYRHLVELYNRSKQVCLYQYFHMLEKLFILERKYTVKHPMNAPFQ